MADLVLQCLLLFLVFKITIAEDDDEISLRVVVGPIVAGAALIEIVTIIIAVCCCVVLKRKLNKSKRFAKSARDQSSTRSHLSHISHTSHISDDGGEDDGTKTIRVVHNTLYESMRSDSGAPMTPVHVDGSSSYATVMGDDVAQNSDSPTERTSRVPMEAEMTKPRSTTGQSSHAYEQVTLKKDGDTDADYINSSAIEAQINETK